ncbi:hypothetical protein SK128_014737 [Halocaridina rubra]|uniref:DUF4105 domain-containing protein n=1 Tax=Halocaridina rubra TaxID=373956 RepID=A0AAN9A0S6_HALRR
MAKFKYLIMISFIFIDAIILRYKQYYLSQVLKRPEHLINEAVIPALSRVPFFRRVFETDMRVKVLRNISKFFFILSCITWIEEVEYDHESGFYLPIVPQELLEEDDEKGQCTITIVQRRTFLKTIKNNPRLQRCMDPMLRALGLSHTIVIFRWENKIRIIQGSQRKGYLFYSYYKNDAILEKKEYFPLRQFEMTLSPLEVMNAMRKVPVKPYHSFYNSCHTLIQDILRHLGIFVRTEKDYYPRFLISIVDIPLKRYLRNAALIQERRRQENNTRSHEEGEYKMKLDEGKIMNVS